MSAMRALQMAKRTNPGGETSIANKIKRAKELFEQKVEAEKGIAFDSKLSDVEAVQLGLRPTGCISGKFMYVNAEEEEQTDEHPDTYTENDNLILNIWMTMHKWENLCADFAAFGVDVSGSDRTVIMLRALKMFSNHK